MDEHTNLNIWDEWFPESIFAELLAGERVIADIGQVRGVWKKCLQKEVAAGRLVKWRGHWYPEAGAPYGTGPLKDCYGTPERAKCFRNAARDAASRLGVDLDKAA